MLIFIIISFAVIMTAIFYPLFQKREVITSNVDGVYDPENEIDEIELEDDYNTIFFYLKELRDDQGNLVVRGQEYTELEECYYNAPHAVNWRHYAAKYDIRKN